MIILDWLNHYSAAVTAIATVVLMLTTAYYAYVTRGLLKENQLLRKAGNEPRMVAFITPHKEITPIMDLVIQNVGTGPAYDVLLKLDGNLEDYKARGARLPNSMGQHSLNVFPQGHYMTLFFGMGNTLLADPKLAELTITFSYRNGQGEVITSRSTISVHALSSLSPESNSRLRDVVARLEDIQKAIKDLGSR